MQSSLDDILGLFSPITLEKMDKVRLMNRIDSKYVTTLPQLIRFLKLTSTEYKIQIIDGQMNMPYRTCYFDTPDFDMFVQHQRGRKMRQKIRIRIYDISGSTFLEIKNKDNKGRTDKKRTGMQSGDDIMKYADFICSYSHYKPEILQPQITNRFRRITLVNKDMTERLTIDTDLRFKNLVTGIEYAPGDIAIIELKRNGRNCSEAQNLLHNLHIHPCGFSKYCIGMALTNRELKHNLLKNRLNTINKLCDYKLINLKTQ